MLWFGNRDKSASCLTAVISAMFAKAFDYQDEPSVAKQGVMTMRYNYGLSTVPNRPIVKPAATARTTGIGLTTVSNQPIVKLAQSTSPGRSGLTTVSNQPIVKPLPANPQTRCRTG